MTPRTGATAADPSTVNELRLDGQPVEAKAGRPPEAPSLGLRDHVPSSDAPTPLPPPPRVPPQRERALGGERGVQRTRGRPAISRDAAPAPQAGGPAPEGGAGATPQGERLGQAQRHQRELHRRGEPIPHLPRRRQPAEAHQVCARLVFVRRYGLRCPLSQLKLSPPSTGLC